MRRGGDRAARGASRASCSERRRRPPWESRSMSDSFDRAPGAGRERSRGLGRGGGGPEGGGFPNGAGPAERSRHQPPPQPRAPGFLQPPPLRQPRTAPPPGAQSEAPAGSARPPRPGALPGTEQLEGAPVLLGQPPHHPPRQGPRAESAPRFPESIPRERGPRSARGRNWVWKEVLAAILCALRLGEGPGPGSGERSGVPGGSRNHLPVPGEPGPRASSHFLAQLLKREGRGGKGSRTFAWEAGMCTGEPKQGYCSLLQALCRTLNHLTFCV